MILACSTCFFAQKHGSAPHEWEDAAGFDDAGPSPRYAVVDGATEAYDAVRWVEHLVGSFVAADGPDLTPGGLRAWFEQTQRLWQAEAPSRFASVIEELKFRQEGSFATFLGCRLSGLDGPDPRWEAAALGDTVLFHVRAGRTVSHFPPLGVEDFGLTPDGLSTHPEALDAMADRLVFAGGAVRAGDRLFLASDAFACWLLGECERDEHGVWALLADLDHDASFAALVADQRAAGRLHNDDVTLLRIRLDTVEPRALVVCLP